MSVKLKKFFNFFLYDGKILQLFYFISETPILYRRAFENSISNLPIDFIL